MGMLVAGALRGAIRSRGLQSPPHPGFEVFLQGDGIVGLGIMRAVNERDRPSARC